MHILIYNNIYIYVVDNENDVDEHEDAQNNNEAYESTKTLTINKRNEEAKTLRKENQKSLVDKRRVVRRLRG